ncbi:MAG: hypothetical protein IT521_03575 [Burkholderiales bacterium]|nr:hypothetical protein [Burkholderiales bacterium]
MNTRPPALRRVPLLALGFAGLVVGVGAGLARLGVGVPQLMASAAALHGPLMVGAFLGVVISLERAVALGRGWAYAGPLLAGAGGIAAIVGAMPLSAWLLSAASAVLVAASVTIFLRQRALFTFTLVAGAACWCAGNLLWARGAAPYQVVAWWLAFLIVTIAGERLELSRFLPPSPFAQRVFVAILVVLGVSLVGAQQAWGAPMFGASLLALAAWLGRQDIAWRTVRAKALTRFIAVCLLSGYFWLAVGGAVIVTRGLEPGAHAYDFAVHALGLGFVFSMIFGHAPVIFPAVLRVKMPYSPLFYGPLLLLHASLLLRVAGDVSGHLDLLRVGAWGNALALAAFVAGALTSVLRGRRSPPRG